MSATDPTAGEQEHEWECRTCLALKGSDCICPHAEPDAGWGERAEQIAQAIEADLRDWQTLGSGPMEIPLHSTAWFVQRAYESAARIARESR